MSTTDPITASEAAARGLRPLAGPFSPRQTAMLENHAFRAI